MVYCRKCGTKLEDNMAYCPKCGTAVAAPYTYENQRDYHRDGHRREGYGAPFGIALAVVASLVIVGVILIALAVVGLLPGSWAPFGTVGSGNMTTQEFAVTDFTGVAAGNGFQVIITQGTTYSVKVTTDDNLQQYVDVQKSGDTLRVRMNAIGWSSNGLKVEIVMPDLSSIDLSGGSTGSASGFNVAHNVNILMSGGSSFTVTGSADSLSTDCSGGSNLHFGDFQVHDAQINFSGGSQGTINLDGTLDANLSGGSHLYYKGNPTLGNINTSSGAGISQAP
ncbi:MAG: DUF2807 domain-containing protein [Candidatus Bathyarchaeota archaeon]|nr:DUF2807 domain-containing protein [Candidatus Bathyarchaeota archaeon]